MGKRSGRIVDSEARWGRLVAKARANLARGRSPHHGFSPGDAEALSSRYSRFEDLRDEEGFLTESVLALHRPDTPRPWLHLMCSNHDRETGIAGSFWDATGLGFLCYDSVLAGPVTSHRDTSYVPTSPRSTDARQFFLREDRAGKPVRIWDMLPQIGREREKYKGYACRYGLGWVVIESARHDLRTRLRVFVPVDDPCEIWTITLTNTSDRPRRIQLFARVNWGLESHPSYYFDPRVTSLGEHLGDLRAIVALNRHRANALPRTGFMMSSAAFQGFDLSGEEFTGGGHFRAFPRAVEEGRCRGSQGLQPYLGLIGALQFDLRLAPARSRSLHIVVGRTEQEPHDYRRHLPELREKLFRGRGVEREFARLQQSWRKMLARVSLRSPDLEVDRLHNVWLKYQQHNTARFTRALDQIGYRDVLQDLMGICSFNPEYVRSHLPTVLNHQLADGRALRQFFRYPNTNAPNDERMYGDSPLWIADTLVSYLEETGDFSLLEQQVGFYDLSTHRQDNRVRKSVYEHALLALEGLYRNRGQRGLCRIGHGDWNDAMDGLSKRGEGVSTWLSVGLIYAAQRLLRLAQHLRDQAATGLLSEIVQTMTRAVNESAWDGDHYVFGFNDDGVAIGSQASEEGRIHAVTNAWTLFTGVAAAAGREEQVLKAMPRLWTPVGTTTIDIPYTQKSRELAGRMADMVPGQFENGAVYTHGHSFLIYALAAMGRGDQAYSELKLSLPGNTFPDIATGPPHQQSNFAVGPSHPNFGMNLYSNFTGSANWYLKAIDLMVGVLPEFTGLRIKPAVPAAWKQYELRKQFRHLDFRFRFHHLSGRSQVNRVSLDGHAIAPIGGEFRIPLAALPAAGGRTIQVEVAL